MGMGKMELISSAAAKMMNAAVKHLTSAEVLDVGKDSYRSVWSVRVKVRKQIHKLWHRFNFQHRFDSKT